MGSKEELNPPKFETELQCNEKVRVLWFETHFSQSHYNFQNKVNGSNACSLIAVIMAAKYHRSKINICAVDEPLDARLIKFLGESMVEGNQLHEQLKQKKLLKHINLTIPEALKHVSNGLIEWKCLLFMERLSESLFENIKTNWIEWMKYTNRSHQSQDLYIILVADSRTVLFYVQQLTDMVILIDSHQHSASKGAFIATSRRSHLKTLCRWFSDMLSNCYKTDPDLYELSFLFFQQ